MRTTQTFMISFFIRKKKNKPEDALLYARISVNGIYIEMSLKRSLEVSRWNQSACKLNGSSMESQQLNKKIDDTKALLYKAYDSLQKEDQVITASAVKSRYLGIDKKHYTLTQLLDYHSTKMKGILKYGTLKNYTTKETYLKNYLSTWPYRKICFQLYEYSSIWKRDDDLFWCEFLFSWSSQLCLIGFCCHYS
ncbi:MAG: Arm DNA-binding domain-containing protein [Zunongwangia sp.]|uniref:Arm DNA-binding domain-containing protein n=1 Tax=Zunongwangia sp. TaxID=1965325 RepID=UPI003242F456